MRLLDLTSLAGGETPQEIAQLVASAREHGCAAVCVYGEALPHAVGRGVRVAAVADFPEGRAPLEAKLAEIGALVTAGADEIDLVVDRAGDVAAEVAGAKEAAGGATLKAILEASAVEPDELRRLARAAIAGGADFLKTSTGKLGRARPEDVRILCEEIRASGRRVGIKPAGGIRTAADAELYLGIVEAELGPAWLVPELCRLGSSALLA